MSHAQGRIYSHAGELLAHFEYNGTSDVSISCLHDSDDHSSWAPCKWRDHKWKKCNCGKTPQTVFIWSNYGRGRYWLGEVCLDCRAIVSEHQYCEEFHEHGDACPQWAGTPVDYPKRR